MSTDTLNPFSPSAQAVLRRHTYYQKLCQWASLESAQVRRQRCGRLKEGGRGRGKAAPFRGIPSKLSNSGDCSFWYVFHHAVSCSGFSWTLEECFEHFNHQASVIKLFSLTIVSVEHVITGWLMLKCLFVDLIVSFLLERYCIIVCCGQLRLEKTNVPSAAQIKWPHFSIQWHNE